MDDLYEKALQETFAKLNIGDEEFKRRTSLFIGNRSEFRNSLLECFQSVVAERVATGDCDASTGYSQAIQFCLRRHHKYVAANNNVCPNDERHQLVYVAAILAFVGNINGLVISALLNDINRCDGTFRYLFGYATSKIYWLKDDYAKRRWRIEFLNFFLTFCTLNKLDFLMQCGRRMRLADVLILWWTLRDCKYDLLSDSSTYDQDIWLLLLRHGANLVDDFVRERSIAFFVNFIAENEVTPWDTYLRNESSEEERCIFREKLDHRVRCVILLFAAVPQAELTLRERMEEPEFRRFLERNSILPPNRCGLEPPELKHLARCKVREALNKNWKLPFGIEELKVPESVKKYLNLGDVEIESEVLF